MSTIPRDKAFYEAADAFLKVANDQLGNVKPATLSAALLFAASRFNAFVIQESSGSKAQFLVDKEPAVAYFVQEYENYLRENIDEHFARYEE